MEKDLFSEYRPIETIGHPETYNFLPEKLHDYEQSSQVPVLGSPLFEPFIESEALILPLPCSVLYSSGPSSLESRPAHSSSALNSPLNVIMTHERDSSKQDTASLGSSRASGGGRRRTRCACIPCNRAKTACDETRPCRRCLRLDMTEQCIDRPTLQTKRRASGSMPRRSSTDLTSTKESHSVKKAKHKSNGKLSTRTRRRPKLWKAWEEQYSTRARLNCNYELYALNQGELSLYLGIGMPLPSVLIRYDKSTKRIGIGLNEMMEELIGCSSTTVCQKEYFHPTMEQDYQVKGRVFQEILQMPLFSKFLHCDYYEAMTCIQIEFMLRARKECLERMALVNPTTNQVIPGILAGKATYQKVTIVTVLTFTPL